MAKRTLAAEIGRLEGKKVTLTGWVNTRRDHGKVIFIDLRDRSGLAQCVFTAKDHRLFSQAEKLRPEWVVKLSGVVNNRPPNLINSDLASGRWEVAADNLTILAQAKTLPISIEGDGYDIGEESRLKYRYLDLRRSRLQKNLRRRHQMEQFVRNFLIDKDFVEIETPILTKSTPEGARDFLTPARLFPGKFYALPQSPQQYKQLLMVAGFERYFQLPRCFRDEDPRGDRQPEFTQLDIEMSFVDEEEIMRLVEVMVKALIKKLFPQKRLTTTAFTRLTYEEAIKQHKTDRPDLREDKNNTDELAFAFITDFPLFEWKKGDKRWGAAHHPFTQPKARDAKELRQLFTKNPAAIKAKQYDLVLNGLEIAGGSLRICDVDLLKTVFELLGNKPEEVRRQFGHLLEAFCYGVPPHGGIAFGLDRLVAILNNEPNIREVIAFPKTGEGQDLMMGAPSKVAASQLKELHLKLNLKK